MASVRPGGAGTANQEREKMESSSWEKIAGSQYADPEGVSAAAKYSSILHRVIGSSLANHGAQLKDLHQHTQDMVILQWYRRISCVLLS